MCHLCMTSSRAADCPMKSSETSWQNWQGFSRFLEDFESDRWNRHEGSYLFHRESLQRELGEMGFYSCSRGFLRLRYVLTGFDNAWRETRPKTKVNLTLNWIRLLLTTIKYTLKLSCCYMRQLYIIPCVRNFLSLVNSCRWKRCTCTCILKSHFVTLNWAFCSVLFYYNVTLIFVFVVFFLFLALKFYRS